jgi:hypothetical membrane protein
MTTIATSGTRSDTRRVSTRTLLACGIAAGPFYLAVVAVQAVTRDGFDVRKHAASLLSVGEHGWIQSANFLITAVLVLAAAAGLRRVLTDGPGHRWAPRLLALYGVGLIGGGIFVPDPALGFPAGTPVDQPVTMSWHGILHFVSGGIGFIGLIACCLVFARRFRTEGQRGWAIFSRVTGIAFLVAFCGIASGSAGAGVTIGFYLAVILAWTWLAATLHKLTPR